MTSQKTTRNLLIFFVLAYAITWLLFLTSVLASNDIAQLPEFTGLFSIFIGLGPLIAAFWLTWREGGREAIKKLGKRGWSFNFDKKWLIPTILL